jgi:hypothetical protein
MTRIHPKTLTLGKFDVALAAFDRDSVTLPSGTLIPTLRVSCMMVGTSNGDWHSGFTKCLLTEIIYPY